MATFNDRFVDADGLSISSPRMTSISTSSDLSDFGDAGLPVVVDEAISTTAANGPASVEALEHHSTFYMHEDMTEIRVCI
jgi:hypothetical protein